MGGKIPARVWECGGRVGGIPTDKKVGAVWGSRGEVHFCTFGRGNEQEKTSGEGAAQMQNAYMNN